MRFFVFFLILGLSFCVSAATVYKKVNPDGSVEYSDVPPDDSAKPMKLKPIQSITLPKPPPASPPPPPEPKPFQYESIRILSPADDEAIRSNNGDFSARAELKPGLREEQEHRLEWLLDGKPVANARGLTLSLKNMDRGTHKLQLRVADFNGKTVIQTPVITFHILRVALGSEAQ